MWGFVQHLYTCDSFLCKKTFSPIVKFPPWRNTCLNLLGACQLALNVAISKLNGFPSWGELELTTCYYLIIPTCQSHLGFVYKKWPALDFKSFFQDDSTEAFLKAEIHPWLNFDQHFVLGLLGKSGNGGDTLPSSHSHENVWRPGVRLEGRSLSVSTLSRRLVTRKGFATTFSPAFTKPRVNMWEEKETDRLTFTRCLLYVRHWTEFFYIGDLISCSQRPCKVGGFILIIPLRKQTLVGKEVDSTLLS